jgi:hypothetical protein
VSTPRVLRAPHLRGFLVVLACVVLSACDEKLSSLTGPTPNLQPTFTSFLTEIAQSGTNQACINCHVQGGIAGGLLNLRPEVAYNNLVNAPSRQKPGAVLVIPGDPENSYLIQKLEGRSGIVQLQMPRNGPPFLTEGQILVIRTWIERGANNN